MHKSKVTTKRGKGQSDSDHRQRLQERMAEGGYVPGTRVAYLREFDRFEAMLDRKGAQDATLQDAKRYLTRLKSSGVSATGGSGCQVYGKTWVM